MNRTKIEWCDYTWNPVTGCLHGCEYCYARRIASRFARQEYECDNCSAASDCTGKIDNKCPDYREYRKANKLHELIQKNYHFYPKKRYCPYPYGFEPTLHTYRLNEIDKQFPTRADVFVCSMADLFGRWVPDEWKSEVLKACHKNSQHNFLFLTKEVSGIPRTSDLYNNVFGRHDENFWFGISINTQADLKNRIKELLNVWGNLFLSIEPIMESIDLESVDTGDVIYNAVSGNAAYLGGSASTSKIQWVIIGAETGNRNETIIPKRQWIERIVSSCQKNGIPVFMKDSLSDIWGEKLIRQKPQELSQYKEHRTND